ncbi:hypothetical protein D3C72_1596650 [compost metagenome]
MLARAGGARQPHHEGRLALRQFIQESLHRRNIGKRVQARRVQAQFRRGLRPAQQQHRQQRDGLARHGERALHIVFEARHAAAAALEDQAQVLQPVDGIEDLGLAHVHDGRAGGLLVAAGGEGVERQRVGIGDGVLFFHQHAEHAAFHGGQGPRRGAGGAVARLAGVGDGIGLHQDSGLDSGGACRRGSARPFKRKAAPGATMPCRRRRATCAGFVPRILRRAAYYR